MRFTWDDWNALTPEEQRDLRIEAGMVEDPAYGWTVEPDDSEPDDDSA